MPNAIGTSEIEPITFSQQLSDAGLATLPFTYGSDGTFHYDPSITQVQKDQIQGVYANHNPNKSRLVNYANTYQWNLATGGFTMTIDTVPRKFATDAESQSLIDSTAHRLEQADGPATVDWQFDTHVVVTVQAADFISAASKIMDFVHATFSTLQNVMAGIDAGTILSEGDIDNAAWPEPFA